MSNSRTRLQGDLSLLGEGKQSFARAQIQLLQAIDSCGSITAAAKQVGISYKTAWDRIDAMNNMSTQPLVTRATGGAKGGGTSLTDLGKQIIQGFLALQEEHEAYISRVGNRLNSLTDVANFIRLGSLRTTCRNQFSGVISAIEKGAANCIVAIKLAGEQTLLAVVSEEGRSWAKLKKGERVIALVKSSWVMLSVEPGFKSSAQNQFQGTVLRIHKGKVNSEVVVDIGEHKSVVANITNAGVFELGLTEGAQVTAFFKASSVVVLVES